MTEVYIPTRERAYSHRGKVYLFRDVLDPETGRTKLVQYGSVVERHSTRITWFDTEEGVSFDELKPLLGEE